MIYRIGAWWAPGPLRPQGNPFQRWARLRCIGQRRQRRAEARRRPALVDQVSLRIYVNGSPLVGPLTLGELATVVYYSNPGERSIVHLNETDAWRTRPFDITAEYTGPG